MAQVKYTNLKLKVNDEVSSFDFNGQTIEVKQYLPVKQKLGLVTNIVNNSMMGRILRDDLVEVYLNLELVEAYTNITFTDKQKQKNIDIYDAFESNGLFDAIIAAIPEDEYNALVDYVNDYGVKLSNMSNIMVSGYSTQVEGMKDVIQQITSENLAKVYTDKEDSAES